MAVSECWLTQRGDLDLANFTLESDNPSDISSRISVSERAFPMEPNKKYPLNHI